MRVAILAAIFIVLGTLLSEPVSATHFFGAAHLPTKQEIRLQPWKYLAETLREGVTPQQFYKLTAKFPTYGGYESLFRRQSIHNPLVWRQGGSLTPSPTPRGRPIPGIPFDTHTGTTAIIPGCLHRLCPPPQGALWVDGVCWCTP